MAYLKIVLFRVSLAANVALEPLALFKRGYRVLNLVLFQISLLREGFWAMGTLEGTNSFMHTYVIQQVPRFRETFVTVLVFANINYFLLIILKVFVNNFFAFVGF